MAQAMKQVQNVNQKERTEVFPSVSNAAESLLFVKHLTNLAIPTILLLRKILPESEFDSKLFEGMTLKILKTGTRNPRTERIQTWLAGAYDALEKKYLKSMSLEIKDTKTDLSLEIYTVNITDNTKSASLSVSILPGQEENIWFREQLSNIQLQTVRLLQMCYSVTKSCLDLPPEVTLFMKLSYQQNVPHDYHPFGYKPYTPAMPIFLKKTKTFEIGIVNTNHHVIEFTNKTCLYNETILTKSGKDKNVDDLNKETESPCYFINRKPEKPKSDFISSQNTSLSTPTNKNDESSREIMNSSQCTDEYSQSDLVRCPCLSKIKTSVMYQCSGCSYWECFGIRLTKVLNAINIFYCQICDKLNNDHHCPDELMTKLNRAADQQKLAVKRRLLSFCNRFDGQDVTFRKLEKVSGLSCDKTVLETVVKDMVNMGVLSQQSGGVYRIIKSQVAQVMPQFFKTGSISKHPVPIHITGKQATQLGKRKLEKTEETDRTVCSNRKSMPTRAAKSLAKRYLR